MQVCGANSEDVCGWVSATYWLWHCTRASLRGYTFELLLLALLLFGWALFGLTRVLDRKRIIVFSLNSLCGKMAEFDEEDNSSSNGPRPKRRAAQRAVVSELC